MSKQIILGLSKNKEIIDSKKIINKSENNKNNNNIKTHNKSFQNNKRPKSAKEALKLRKAKKNILNNRKKTLEKQGVKEKKKFNWKKWIIISLVIIILLFAWKLIDFPGKIMWLLEQNPTIWAMYQSIMSEVEARTLVGLAYASFFGSLFFISLPVEAIFLYYLGLNYYVVQIMTITLITNLAGMIINYFLGWLIGEKVVKFFMKKSYHEFRKKLDRAGAFVILFGNVIPFPIEIFAVFLGAVKYKFRWYMLYTTIGKIIKFILLVVGYGIFVKFVAPHLEGLTISWFIDKIKNIFMFW